MIDTPIRKGWLKPVMILRRVKDKDGYWILTVQGHYLLGEGRKRIAEHRLVMTEKIGRKLRSKEHVHHDKIRRITHNHPDNLVIVTHSEHTALHNRERKISETTRQKFRKNMLGNERLKGHRHSESTREKMRRSHTGVPKGPTSRATKIKIALSRLKI